MNELRYKCNIHYNQIKRSIFEVRACTGWQCELYQGSQNNIKLPYQVTNE